MRIRFRFNIASLLGDTADQRFSHSSTLIVKQMAPIALPLFTTGTEI
jgi:hypothetical protein